MSSALTGLTVVGALVVLGVLVAGLWNLLRAGSSSVSQNLMRWRIGLQFGAIVVAMLILWITKS
ncbi:MAG: twin transmembrane helix small protein [Pseudomonadota bacterium]